MAIPDPSTLPSGAVTLLMTDMEGSTRWLAELGSDFGAVMNRHHELIRSLVTAGGGEIVDATGDSHFSVFHSPEAAVSVAAGLAATLEREPWPKGAKVRVRSGIHLGAPRLSQQRYVGLDVHRAARICSAGHGGQVLLSAATCSQLDTTQLPGGVRLRELGTCKLKDLRFPETLWELLVPGLPEKFPPVRGTQPTNLPPPAAEFVGRKIECEKMRALALGDARVVTITGPGGVGKTRLVTEAARSLQASFPDGLFLVHLDSLSDPSLVLPTIADVLAIPEMAGRPVLDGIKHHLASSRTLLILDNFEHVLEAAPIVADLVSHCDRLRLFVTSRAPLNIRFEKEIQLQPLELLVPGADAKSPGSESSELFLSLVREFRPEYAPDLDEAIAIEEICRRVDGLPLAIELAASRLRVLTPRALLEKLEEGIGVLSGGRRDAARRHRALLDTITWSYDLLEPEEQALFRRLSVFAGGFGLDAAEAIAKVEPSATDALDVVTTLVQKSLLKPEEVNAETRFRMLQTIREFGSRELITDPLFHTVCAQHAEFFTRLAEDQAPLLLSKDRRRALARLSADADNLRAAFAWALEQPDGRVTARLLQALLWLRISQGQFAEGRNWTERALRQAQGLDMTVERGLILDAAGWLHLFAGDYAGSLPHCAQALAIFSDLNLLPEIARTKLTLGIARAVTGQEDGPALLQESLALHQKLDDPYGIALSLTALGEGARMAGQTKAARECYENAVALYTSLGNVYWPAALKHNIAHFCLHEQDWGQAVKLLADLLYVAREFDFPMMVGHYLAAMGGVAVVRQKYELAARLFGAVDSLLANLGAGFEPTDQAELDHNSAAARQAMGEPAFERSRAAGRELSTDQAISETLSLRA